MSQFSPQRLISLVFVFLILATTWHFVSKKDETSDGSSLGRMIPGEAHIGAQKCNILGTKGTRFLMFNLSFRSESPELQGEQSLAEILSPRWSDGPSTMNVRIQAVLLKILSSYTLDELDSTAGREKILAEIQTQVSYLVKAQAPQIKGRILECYFTEFFIQ